MGEDLLTRRTLGTSEYGRGGRSRDRGPLPVRVPYSYARRIPTASFAHARTTLLTLLAAVALTLGVGVTGADRAEAAEGGSACLHYGAAEGRGDFPSPGRTSGSVTWRGEC
ncbi:hypothetical protein ABZO31_20335 [Streptomyces sp. HUAS MG47]|uniref:hypothetical protein n=1 Tax=Streptomyces solicamelliae TaxID=3231716 RepID=UPI0038784392